MEWRNGVILYRVFLRRRIAFAFLREHMDERGPIDLLDVFQGRHHLGDIMPVDRTDILKPQTLEKEPRRNQSQKRIPELARQVFKIFAARQALEQGRKILLQSNAEIGGELLTEKRRHRTHSGVDKMFIVV